MNRRQKKAIKILQNYIVQIDQVSNAKEGNTWKAKVLDSLKRFIGTDSNLYTRFNNEFFTKKVTTNGRSGDNWVDLSTYTNHVYMSEYKQNFVITINDIIQHITNHGLMQNYTKTNFLSQFSTMAILGSIIPIAGVIFWLGTFSSDILSKTEINELNDSLLKLNETNKHLELDNKKLNEVLMDQSEYLDRCDSLYFNNNK